MAEKEFIFWVGLLILFLIVEIITVGLTSIWFAGGSLVAAIACLAGGSELLQVILFFAVSFILLYFTRPWAIKFIRPKNVKTNYEEIAGKTVKVIERVDNVKGTGKVLYNGMEWTARAQECACIFEVDELAQAVGVQGVKMILKKLEEDGGLSEKKEGL